MSGRIKGLSEVVKKVSNSAKKEVEFILDSIDGDVDLYKLVKSIFQSYVYRGIDLRSVDEAAMPNIIVESTHYKLARILKSVRTWEAYVAEVSEELGMANPRWLLRLGGFKWKIPFSVPTKRKYMREKVSLRELEERLTYLEIEVARLKGICLK